MEDLATAEIGRSQLWRWVHHGVALEDGTRVDRALMEADLAAELGLLVGEGADVGEAQEAAELLRTAALGGELPPFMPLLLTPAG